MAIVNAPGGCRHGLVRKARPVAEVLEGRQLLAAITVNSAGDADGADGGTTLSLRQAIEVANGTLAVAALTSTQQSLVSGALSSPNTIDFDIAGTGPFTIKPATALPNITAPTFFDGYSQPGASPNTGGLGQADNAILKIGLDFSDESGTGGGLEVLAAGSTVQGLALFGAQSGEELLLAGPSPTAGSAALGDFIGTDTTGINAPANHASGLVAGALITIGGVTPASRDIISGNAADGVYLQYSLTAVEGDFIGTDATGSRALPNDADGVRVFQGLGNTVGGTAAGAGNVISGNSGNGVHLAYALEDVPQAGTVAVPTETNLIQGNLIGTDLTGSKALGNGGAGVFIDGGKMNTIGGTAAGAGNVIGFNGGAGVSLAPSIIKGAALNYYDTISANSIDANGGPGIDLNADGTTPNTTTGTIVDPNELQPYPVSTGVVGTTLLASLTSAPSTSYTVEFFASAKNTTGFGEGEFYLGSQAVTTGSTGVATFSYSVPAADFGLVLSMTATDPAGNTSEFTPQSLNPAPAPAVPVVAVAASSTTVAQGRPLTLVAAVGSTAAGQPTGLVGFVVDGTVVGFAPLDAQGFATLSVPTGQIAVGAGHQVLAAYQGDSTFAPSLSGSPFRFAVTQPSTIALRGSATSLETGPADHPGGGRQPVVGRPGDGPRRVRGRRVAGPRLRPAGRLGRRDVRDRPTADGRPLDHGGVPGRRDPSAADLVGDSGDRRQHHQGSRRARRDLDGGHRDPDGEGVAQRGPADRPGAGPGELRDRRPRRLEDHGDLGDL